VIAEVLSVLELTPWNGRPYNTADPDGWMRHLDLADDRGFVTYLDDRQRGFGVEQVQTVVDLEDEGVEMGVIHEVTGGFVEELVYDAHAVAERKVRSFGGLHTDVLGPLHRLECDEGPANSSLVDDQLGCHADTALVRNPHPMRLVPGYLWCRPSVCNSPAKPSLKCASVFHNRRSRYLRCATVGGISASSMTTGTTRKLDSIARVRPAEISSRTQVERTEFRR
jgi:hypothetical protein